MPTTVEELINTVSPINAELTLLKKTIAEAYDTMDTTPERELVIQTQINDYNKKSAMYDRLFQEKEATLQASGGNERQETLQEYCILFFYVAYGILAVAICIFFATTEGAMKAGQLFLVAVVILIPITGLIIRYG